MRQLGFRQWSGCASGFCVAMLASTCSTAGAFLEPPGQGQVIATFTSTTADKRLDASGRLNKPRQYSKAHLNIYAEYGVAEWVTLVFSPSLQHIGGPSAAPTSYSGIADSMAGARIKLAAFGPAILSVQLGAVSAGDFAGAGNGRLAGKAALQGEARLMAGAGFACGPWNCFVDAQAAWRSPNPAISSDFRADVTLGMRPWETMLVMLQAFATFRKSRVPAAGLEQSHKLQASVVYDFARQYAVQLGTFATIAGRNTARERGVLGAIWHKF